MKEEVNTVETEIAQDLRRAEECSRVYPADAGKPGLAEHLADSSAEEGGLLHQAAAGVRCVGASVAVSEDGRVPGPCGADLQKVRGELLRSRAIRELGKNAMAYALANREAYVSWHMAEYGMRPEGF